jgi:hypothetical protein
MAYGRSNVEDHAKILLWSQPTDRQDDRVPRRGAENAPLLIAADPSSR